MLSAIIIDDEDDSIEALVSTFDLLDLDIKVLNTANSVEKGIELLNSVQPDLLFLDVRLGDELSFEIFDHISNSDFQIIFVSGYDEYAVRAFKYSAIDYLLKPVDPDELVKAIDKVKKSIVTGDNTYDQLKTLLQNIKAPRPFMFSVPTSDGVEFINIDELFFIKAEGSYSVLSFQRGKDMLVSKNIGEFQGQLPEDDFCRVHNSFLINLRHVKKIRRKGGLTAEMQNGEMIPVSRNKKDQFMQKIDQYLIQK